MSFLNVVASLNWQCSSVSVRLHVSLVLVVDFVREQPRNQLMAV